jgi:anti-sigma factor RsiW
MTITHEVEREEVMAYLDGELAPTRAAAVATHLGGCAECSAFAADLRGVSNGLAEWSVESAPDRLVAPAGVVVEPRNRGGIGAWIAGLFASGQRRWVLAGAAMVGLALFVVASQGILRRLTPVQVERPWVAAQAADQVHALGYANGSLLRSARVASAGGDTGRGAAATAAQAAAPFVEPYTLDKQLSTSTTDTEMIVRTATVNLSTDKFDEMRAALERVATAHHGSISGLQLGGDPPNQRTLSVTLRVPVADTDAALSAVRSLGKVQQESQSSEDVSDSHRDLAVRIANAKVEEARLGEILKDRTGKIADVLAVEEAQSRVRGEIERMEAEELAMRNRAAQSTITVEVAERYVANLADETTPSIGMRLRNAMVDGAKAAIEGVVSVVLAVLTAAPTIAIWFALLFFPVRWAWRRLRGDSRARPQGAI